MDKKLLVILAAIPAVSLTLSWHVLNLGFGKQPDINLPEQGKHLKTADTFFNQVKIINFAKTGLPKSKIIGDNISHYPGDTDSEISTPEVTLFRESGSPVDISAAQGLVNKDASRVILRGNTIIKRESSAANQFFLLETPELYLWPDKNIAETDKAVRITTDSTITTGTGMKAYLETEHYYLLNNVKIQHLPNKSAISQ